MLQLAHMAQAEPRVSWQIEEYTHKEKNPDWYWALGVIAIASCAIAIIYHDILFGVFIILGAGILGFYAKRPPELVDIAISEDGVAIRNYLYPFEKIKGFAIHTHEGGSFLLIESSRALIPVISIALPEEMDAEDLTELLKTKIPEKKLEEPVSHRLMEHLGF
jgi:hypothetical protein